MIESIAVLALASSTALLASGYLFGARSGRRARAALQDELQRHGEHAAVREQLIAGRDQELALRDQQIALREQQLAELSHRTPDGDRIAALLGPLVTARSGDAEELRQLRQELRQGLAAIDRTRADPEQLRRDLQRTIQPLLQRRDDTAAVRETVRELLAPMLDHERLGRELAQLPGGTSLGELPRLLDAIADRGGFSAVVLSDEVGLPLAASASARDVELLAGTASFVLTLADRAARDGAPRPLAVVVLDESNQHVLHRIFVVDGTRFTLTAVSRGVHVAPGALDAALAKLEAVLGRKAA